MNKLLVSLLLTLGLTGLAHAAGDAAAGQAKAAVCGACHGADGNSPAPNFPKLAGQGERYLLKQMHDIKDGKRTVLEMTGLLTNLSDQDLADIAAYFASQKMSVGMADPNLVAQGEALFRGGKIADGVQQRAVKIEYHSSIQKNQLLSRMRIKRGAVPAQRRKSTVTPLTA